MKSFTLRMLSIGFLMTVVGCSLFVRDPAKRCYVDETGPVCNVTLIELISRPEVYSGRRVRVPGWLHLEFEGDALYLHREDYERSVLQNSLRISAPDGLRLRAREFSDQYCILGGTFVSHKAEANVIGSLSSGGLKDLTTVLRLPETRDEWLKSDNPTRVWYSTP